MKSMWLQLIGEEPTTESVIPSGCQTRERAASATADGRSSKAAGQQNARVRRRNKDGREEQREAVRSVGVVISHASRCLAAAEVSRD